MAAVTVTIIMNITNRMIIMTIVTAVMTTMIIVIAGVSIMTIVTAAMNIITTTNITMPAAAAVAADTTITKIKRSSPCCFWAQASLRRVFWQICF